jgi:RNA polymerase sigma-70 factor (ECF subfamily)
VVDEGVRIGQGSRRKSREVQEPDPRVIRAAAAGDLDAFSELVRAYQMEIWRFLRHLLGDDQLAEDVAQETFLRAHRHLGGFAFRSKFSTWLFRIARNAGIDALRARDRNRRLVRRLPAPRDTPDAALRTEVTTALRSLPEVLRESFVLVESLGFTYREAAETVGVPEGTVKSRVFRARKELVRWLDAGTASDRRSGAL